MNIGPLLTFYFIKSQAQFRDIDINFQVGQSLLYLLEKFFMQRSSSFMFVLSTARGSQHTMYFLRDLIENLFMYWGIIKTQIMFNTDVAGPTRSGERIYNLFMIDSWEAFLKLDLASKVQNYDINEFYHIYLQQKDAAIPGDIKKILTYCWKNYIINVNIQVQTAKAEIIVYSYFPFTESHCGKVVPVEINRFHNGTMRSSVLFPEKLRNMHNCPLKVATWHAPPYVSLDFSKKGREAIGGFEGELLRQLSKLLNFNIHIVVPPNKEERGIIFGNHTTGAINMLRQREVDLSLGCFWFAEKRSRLLTASHSYFQETNAAVLLASSANYATTQALWFPFKRESSIALLAAYVITLGLLFGQAWLADMLQEFFPDLRHRNICLNFVACTLGMTSAVGPRRSSWRIFIIAWMLFVLIIRTEYGAVIYHLIRNNLYRKPPSTIRDIAKLNYTFALTNVAYIAVRQTTIFAETGLGHVLIPDDYDGGTFAYLENHPNEKLVSISPLDFLLYYVAKNRKVGVLTILKESFFLQNTCIYFTKHSFLVDRINFFVQRINAVGLLNSWMKQSIDLSYLMAKRAQKEYTIGQMELKGVYYLCGMFLVASSLVFCLEIMSLRFQFLRDVLEKL